MIIRKTLFASAMATAVLAASLAPAFAFADEAECRNTVSEVTRELLKASVSTTALHEIDGILIAANAKCTSDLAGAQSLVDEARQKISAAAG